MIYPTLRDVLKLEIVSLIETVHSVRVAGKIGFASEEIGTTRNYERWVMFHVFSDSIKISVSSTLI